MTNEELCIAIKQGNKQYISVLWDNIYHFICMRANSFYNKNSSLCICAGVTIDDLSQEGYFAMLYAIKAYDENKGYKFITYMGYPLQTRFITIIGYRTSKSQNEPLNCSASLDKPIGETEEDGTLNDIIEDETSENPFISVEDKEYRERLRKDINTVLNRLTEKERDVIIKHYFDNMTYKQIMDCTNTNNLHSVLNISDKALKKMRHPVTGKELTKYREDIISRSYHHIGVNSFNSSWTSQTEHAALYLNDRYKNINEY